MTFTDRQRRAMRLIADTFAPGGDGVPSAHEAGAVDLALEIVAGNPRRAEATQVRRLLDVWDTRGFALAVTGRGRRFSELDRAGRERFLLGLAGSGIAQKRVLFAALKTASVFPYYMAGGPRLWESIGYPGPLGVRDDPPEPVIRPLRATSDTEVDCDVVVVGSGAGGGTAAGVLAAAGLDVVVLEAGDLHDERHFDGSERTGFLELYALAPQATADGQVSLLAGRGLGGGTVVNYSTSFRTPDHVRQEWAAHGARQVATDEYTASMDAVCQRLGVNTDHDKAAPRDAILERGARALGGTWPPCRATSSGATRTSSAGAAGWAAGSGPSSR
ncbi:GMC family oxidoreductase N-terminal domain-containing protein [Nocardioides sp. TF02-7]|uniref:GMC family oxidoreductase N-terminal domain-containing protein n=1 Tax=Nocardioides sp. TF02-7 TaxID=2917724 RepID=UPI001F0604A6|nr:GMC family oxidoreductase N-terminal domain-containing protein [Nocardioides sp. TF02-7]UMG92397.1 GMC family oxidoreductase N-terminal domain-containing protein [Nocardioides sp. TF02-7]